LPVVEVVAALKGISPPLVLNREGV
jgi:hypothetical protein